MATGNSSSSCGELVGDNNGSHRLLGTRLVQEGSVAALMLVGHQLLDTGWFKWRRPAVVATALLVTTTAAIDCLALADPSSVGQQ